jgi:eukaryotic-like serine/threonine-protein kinase
VLLNCEGVVKITDFGIAKAREVMEQDEKILMGRMEYMSPEQARRSATDGRSDIYSLGVLLYELLTGEVPTRGAGSLERLHRLGMSYAKPVQELRPEVGDDLAGILERALQPEPGDRFQTAGEMGYALEYHLYHKGYGPTNVTLGDYVKGRFPSPRSAAEPLPERRGPTGQTLDQRADTLFGERLNRLLGED